MHTAPLDPPLGRGNHEHDWTRFRRRTHSTPEFKIIKYRQVGLYWLIPKKWNFANKNNLKAVYFLFHRFSISWGSLKLKNARREDKALLQGLDTIL